MSDPYYRWLFRSFVREEKFFLKGWQLYPGPSLLELLDLGEKSWKLNAQFSPLVLVEIEDTWTGKKFVFEALEDFERVRKLQSFL